MLKGLRLRLFAVCLAMTGAVFLALLLVMAANSQQQYEKMNSLLFRDRVSTIVNRLQTDDVIESQWLMETEYSQRCVIALESNGAPLLFRGAWTPQTDRNRLIDLARERARVEGLDYKVPPLDFSKRVQQEFLLEGDNGDAYRCAVVLLPVRENWISLTLLDDIMLERAHIRRQQIFYLCLSLMAIAALGLLSWWFTGRAIQPTAAGIERQREFVAAASHELKSPLAVIESTAAAIRVAPARMDELTRGIESECRRLGRLVSDLLLLAHTDTASWQLNTGPVGIEAILMEVMEQYRAMALKKGFSLELELPEEILPTIQGDGERIQQMLSILVDNALSYSGDGGVIRLRAFQTPRQILVEVIDHGLGIPPEMRQQVFERFCRMDKARTGKNHFGLGLPIVKELIRLHKGMVSLSETEGGGCTFRLTFPK